MADYLYVVASAVVGGLGVRLLDWWRAHRGEQVDQAVAFSRLVNHQKREEDRWADEEQRWSLVTSNEGKLSERMAVLETSLREFRARYEEEGGRRR